MKILDGHAIVADLIQQFPGARRFCIAYSGGMDSRVLLDLMVAACGLPSTFENIPTIEAWHVDHGIQQASPEWAEHCRQTSITYGIPFKLLHACIDLDSGESVEAMARDERYRLFSKHLNPDDLLLLAQHSDDQAETFLLQALRGSGVAGLAAMPYCRQLSKAKAVRPLLSITQQQIRDYAKQRQLQWVEDPSNQDQRYDRNFLRQTIMPLLQQRFTGLNAALTRSAFHCGDAKYLIDQLSQSDLSAVMTEDQRISIPELNTFARQRQSALLRRWISLAGYQAPQAAQLEQVINSMLTDSYSNQELLQTREFEIRRYRDHLHLMKPLKAVVPFHYIWPAGQNSVMIIELNLSMDREQLQQAGLYIPVDAEITLKSRKGGEKLLLGQPGFHKSVKKILQEQAVEPWLRDRVVLIYLEAELISIFGIKNASKNSAKS